MYCLPIRRKTGVWKGIVRILELTEQQSCGIRKNAKYAGFDHCSGSKIHLNLGTGCDTRKENDFRDAGIPRDCRREERECGMRTLFSDPEKHGCQKCKGRIRGTQRLLSVKYLFERKQILPRIFYYLRTSKKFQMTVPFMYNFRSLCYKFLTIFWSFILHILLLRLGYFSYCSKKET